MRLTQSLFLKFLLVALYFLILGLVTYLILNVLNVPLDVLDYAILSIVAILVFVVGIWPVLKDGKKDTSV